ncbi:MAG: hypothetical protein ACFFAH_13070 [Promethearchaeota archaeon]
MVLSHFDRKQGPKVFLNVPELPDLVFLDQFPRLMDFYEEAFFIHEFGELKTSNLIFTIPSPVARGGQETLMISILILNDEETNPKIFQNLLEQFAHEFIRIKEVYKGLYREEQNFKDSQEIYKKIKDLLNSVYHSLPQETIFIKAREFNLVMFEFLYKSPIAREFISIDQFYKNRSEDSNLLHSKLSISRYSISRIRSLMNVNPSFLLFQLKNKDGFIFFIDVNIKGVIQKAKRIFNKIFKFPEIATKPILIIINQIGLYNLQIQKIQQDLGIIDDENKIIKYIPFNFYNNDDISEAFSWIVDKTINNKLKSIANY